MIKEIQKKLFLKNQYKHFNGRFSPFLFCGFCLILGIILRFTLLISKPVWTDEFATLVFSLGNSYNLVPLNEIITIDQLLQPLQYNSDKNLTEIASLLINEDNHPPLYFLLANLWYKLFPHHNQYLSLWAARSLPALLGIFSIPAIYYLAKISCSSPQTAYLATWLMTVSPYGIYLAQEARHYTLGILFVIASVSFLVIVIKLISQNKIIPIWLVVGGIIINILGFLTHYFFLITLLSEGIVLIIYFLTLFNKQAKKRALYLARIRHNFIKILLVAITILVTVIYWFLFIIPQDYGNGMTAWIESDKSSFFALISPIFQLLATLITMVSLLPVESTSVPVILFSGLIMAGFFLWLLPQVFRGMMVALKTEQSKITNIFLVFCLTTITIFLVTTYFLNMDITRGARYSFVYFPIFILLFAIALTHNQIFVHRKSLLILGIMGLLSALTVITNLGYQKYYRPDLLIPIIKANSGQNILIATTHQTLVQTGEMMSLAQELKKNNHSEQIRFLLAHQNYQNDPKATLTLQQAMKNLNFPLDLWLVNFYSPIKLDNCSINLNQYPQIDGYNYQMYQCFGELPQSIP